MKPLGITPGGLKAALSVKEHYRSGQPLCLPGKIDRILIPETLLNAEIDLQDYEDPLPLAMMAIKDPESPMALAAATRLGPLGKQTELVAGVFRLVGEATRHPLVAQSVELITENSFNPVAVAHVRRHAAKYIVRTRQQYTTALRQNLQALLEGVIAPRQFVKEFFELTAAGNMRHQIRGKLVLSLLSSPTIRPSIKFLMLENFEKFPESVRFFIISGILKAEPSRHLDVIKEELRWIIRPERQAPDIH
ncbi:MAG: hypothetical protein OEY85_08070 [Rhodospirillales bacterium]|nr:hypothetical protein [Rhodospirillales bacterium]